VSRFVASVISITIATAVLCLATAATAGTLYEYSHRTGFQQYVSRGEYKHWISDGRVRVDRTPVNVEMPADSGHWQRLILRPDLGVQWQIDDINKTYVESPIDSLAPPSETREFVEQATRAVETLADVDTRRTIFWTGGGEKEEHMRIVDAWLAEENPEGVDPASFYPTIRRDLDAVAEEGVEEGTYAMACSFLSGARMPMRLIIGPGARGLTSDRLAIQVRDMNPYARLPMMKTLEFELFEITEVEVPDGHFDLPEGYREITR
jgi:hypothetical protein